VDVTGDYHVAVSKQSGGLWSFNRDEFIASRPAKFRPMLTTLLSSQAFHQFIDERLDAWNSSSGPPSDVFEQAISQRRDTEAPAKV